MCVSYSYPIGINILFPSSTGNHSPRPLPDNLQACYICKLLFEHAFRRGAHPCNCWCDFNIRYVYPSFISSIYRFRVLVQAKFFLYPRSKQRRVQWIFSASTPPMISPRFQAGRGGSKSPMKSGRARRGQVVRWTLLPMFILFYSDSYSSHLLCSAGIVNDRGIGYDPSSRLILSIRRDSQDGNWHRDNHLFYRRCIWPHPLSLRPWEGLLRPVYLFVRRLWASEANAWYVMRLNYEFSLILILISFAREL